METGVTAPSQSQETDEARKNHGDCYERTKYNPREKAFADAWDKENERNAHVNYGYGILQDLFCKPDPIFGHTISGVSTKVITDDERKVAATVIQWLGSNCGWCFLEEVIKECGYKLVRESQDSKK